MSKFDILNDLIEGRLKDSSEKSIYAELSADSAMRQELRDLLSVNNSINNNKSLFVPASGAKDAIFGKIGLATGGAAVATFWNSKWFYSAMSSVATFLIMFGVYLGLGELQDESSDQIAQNFEMQQIELEKLSELEVNNNFNDNTNLIFNNNDNFNKKQSGNNKIAFASNKNEKANRNSDFALRNLSDEEANESENSKITSSDKEDINLYNAGINFSELSDNQVTSFYLENNYQIKPIDNKQQEEIISSFESNNLYSRFSLEWNNSESVHFPEERITPSEFALFHKNSLSMLYDINDRLTIGANARQETFYLVFRGLGEDGIQRIYEQQPNLTSFSGLLRYDIFEWKNELPLEVETFTELQLGGNTLGPVGRIGFGLEIRPTQNITFVVSGNYSQLRYWHQNNGFRSEKFSLNYGVKFGL